MTWADFYLICFVVGLLSASFRILPGARAGISICLIFLTARPHAGARSRLQALRGSRTDMQAHVSPFNFVTLTAFLAWFGGIGYLLTRYSGMWFADGIGIALLSGLAEPRSFTRFLARVLMSKEENMDPADYDMVGVLGKLSRADPRRRAPGS